MMFFLTSRAQTQKDLSNQSITIGILNGGGSLVGVDYEILTTPKLGMQVGFGYLGFGAGINYHFNPSIRSSFISLQYWNQGIRGSFVQNVIGPTYIYRGKKWFTFQIGAGAVLSRTSYWPENVPQSPVILLYSIGGYIPI